MNGCQEAACQLVVSRSEGTVLLQLCKEILDQVPGSVGVLVEVAGLRPICPRRYDCGFGDYGGGPEHPRGSIKRLADD